MEKSMMINKDWLQLMVARKNGERGYLVMIGYRGNASTITFKDKEDFNALNIDLNNKSDLLELLLGGK